VGRLRALRLGAIVLTAAPLIASCSGSSGAGHNVSTFHLKVGNCVVPPKQVKAELSDVRVVSCTQPHTQEAYAVLHMSGDVAKGDAPYPGPAVLKQFADGQCAQNYTAYVGVAYPDSSLFFTYLLPSPRGWQADDRSVVCIVTTTGSPLTKSVKGSRL
jgi:hypothetical protein